jgi:hypothetical protein
MQRAKFALPSMVTLMSIACGFGSIAGVLLLTYLAWNSDRTPKAPKWMPPPPPNIPEPVVPGLITASPPTPAP